MKNEWVKLIEINSSQIKIYSKFFEREKKQQKKRKIEDEVTRVLYECSIK